MDKTNQPAHLKRITVEMTGKARNTLPYINIMWLHVYSEVIQNSINKHTTLICFFFLTWDLFFPHQFVFPATANHF